MKKIPRKYFSTGATVMLQSRCSFNLKNSMHRCCNTDTTPDLIPMGQVSRVQAQLLLTPAFALYDHSLTKYHVLPEATCSHDFLKCWALI
jgi:hypothetical protein